MYLSHLKIAVIVCTVTFFALSCKGTQTTVETVPPTRPLTQIPTAAAATPIGNEGTLEPTVSVRATATLTRVVVPTSISEPFRFSINPIPIERARTYGCSVRENINGRRQFGTAPAPTPEAVETGSIDPKTSEPIIRYVAGISLVTGNLTDFAAQIDELITAELAPTEIAAFASDFSKRLTILCDALSSLDRPASKFLSSVDVKTPMLAYAAFAGSLIRSIQQPGSVGDDDLAKSLLDAASSLDDLTSALEVLDIQSTGDDELLLFEAADGSSFEVLAPLGWLLVAKPNSIALVPPSRVDPLLGEYLGPVDWPGINGVRVRFLPVMEGSNIETIAEIYSEVAKSFGSVESIEFVTRNGRNYADVSVVEDSDLWSYSLRLGLGDQFVFIIEAACLVGKRGCDDQIRTIFESFQLTD